MKSRRFHDYLILVIAFFAMSSFATAVEIDIADREASRQFFFDQYVSGANTTMSWTGSHTACEAGATSQAFRDEVVQQINYFRAMAGVPAEIMLSDSLNAKAQEAALMMSANNNLSHTPSDSWVCHTDAGSDGAANSNLSLGRNGARAVADYIHDPGTGNEPVGHRRWILHPQTTTMGTGDIPRDGRQRETNALWVLDGSSFGPRPETRDPFVAWPPAGFVPHQVVFPRWSFSLDSADFSKATVSVTLDGDEQALDIMPIVNGFGENTVVWELDDAPNEFSFWPTPEEDTVYSVSIDNIGLSGEQLSYQYDVTIFNPSVRVDPPLRGDFDGDMELTSRDIDLLTLAIQQGGFESRFDLSGDNTLSLADTLVLVEELMGTFPGDADLNLSVDFGDFLTLARNFGKNGGWRQGDFDSTGDVQFPDFLLLARNFGRTQEAAAATVIPEPSSWMLCFAFAGLLALRRRRVLS